MFPVYNFFLTGVSTPTATLLLDIPDMSLVIKIHAGESNRMAEWLSPRSVLGIHHTLMLTESAIDALSAWCLDECRRPGTVILSAAGVARRVPEWAEAWKPERILVAFDADPVGDRNADRLVSEDRRARRIRPPDGHEDWNAVLKARAAAFPSKQP